MFGKNGPPLLYFYCLLLAQRLAGILLRKDGIDFDMFYFAAIAAILMIWLNIMPHQKYTKAISWDLLITIASAFAIAKAMQNSGAADALARNTITIAQAWGPIGVLAAVFLLTSLFTEIITNNAAAALVFPVALSAANQMGVDPQPVFVANCYCSISKFCNPNWLSNKFNCSGNWELQIW